MTGKTGRVQGQGVYIGYKGVETLAKKISGGSGMPVRAEGRKWWAQGLSAQSNLLFPDGVLPHIPPTPQRWCPGTQVTSSENLTFQETCNHVRSPNSATEYKTLQQERA